MRPPTKSQANDLGDAVDKERHDEQRQGRQKQSSKVCRSGRCLGHLGRNRRREGLKSIKNVPVDDRRVAGGHEHDHRFADRAAQANHHRRKQPAHRRRNDNSQRRLPLGCAATERGRAKMRGNARQRVVGDRVNQWDDGKTHHESDDERVSLNVGPQHKPAGIQMRTAANDSGRGLPARPAARPPDMPRQTEGVRPGPRKPSPASGGPPQSRSQVLGHAPSGHERGERQQDHKPSGRAGANPVVDEPGLEIAAEQNSLPSRPCDES